ncbi:hypothetical protein [Seonamhaeicola sp. S2-3]|uniref:hypothetical protein n=1 Tax=Seonamhaeicola sp. S2-3 TaxID=1936081 RepID=UPI0012F8DEE4|nr:hypothetical protein [Seonamhaeicola sp. S2-3]
MNNLKTNKYNEVVCFGLNRKLNFPDFTIQNTKHQKIQGPNNAKWERQTFYFTITSKQDSFEITWSTGRIQNTKFTLNKTTYELAMGSYQDSTSKAFKSLALNELIIVKVKKVKLVKHRIKTDDIVFRSTLTKKGEVFFNEFGTIEKTPLGLFVWDFNNTIKQPLKNWSSKGINQKIAVYRITSPDFQINNIALKNGNFNYLFDSENLELVTQNF